MARITHPTIPGSDVDVPDASLPHYRESGWLVIGVDVDGPTEPLSEAPAEPTAEPADTGGAAGDSRAQDEDEVEAASGTKAPKRRPSSSAKED